MINNSKASNYYIKALVICTCIVHLVFIVQLLFAVPRGGLILPNFYLAFFPHAVLMYSFPPEDPMLGGNLSVVRLIGKILIAVPASMIYGAVVASIALIINRIRKRADQHEKVGPTIDNSGGSTRPPLALTDRHRFPK